MSIFFGVLGALILLSPIIALFVVVARTEGILVALKIFGVLVLALLFLGLGAYLLQLAGWVR